MVLCLYRVPTRSLVRSYLSYRKIFVWLLRMQIFEIEISYIVRGIIEKRHQFRYFKQLSTYFYEFTLNEKYFLSEKEVLSNFCSTKFLAPVCQNIKVVDSFNKFKPQCRKKLTAIRIRICQNLDILITSGLFHYHRLNNYFNLYSKTIFFNL